MSWVLTGFLLSARAAIESGHLPKKFSFSVLRPWALFRKTPVLVTACDKAYYSIVEILLQKGENVNKTTPHVSVDSE